MRKLLREYRGFIAFLVLIGVFRTAVADWNPVPTGSMRPTIQEGDVVLVDRTAYSLKVPLTDHVLARLGEPVRGDIVVFASPADGVRLVKRVVALPGDRVQMRDKQLWINGTPATYAPVGWASEHPAAGTTVAALRLRETAGGPARTVQWLRPEGGAAHDDFGPIVIPADRYLMLGDNRDNSADSRWFGLVPRELLVGRAHRVLVAADIQDDWAPRFERFGKRLE
jgi:signal peptidase I